MSQLSILKDDKLKQGIQEVIDQVAKVAPPDVLTKYQLNKEKVEAARKQLKEFLAVDENTKQREVLARILGSGMMVVTDAKGKVIAIEQPVKKEMKIAKIIWNRFRKT